MELKEILLSKQNRDLNVYWMGGWMGRPYTTLPAPFLPRLGIIHCTLQQHSEYRT